VVIMARGRVIREGAVQELTARTGRVTFEVDPLPPDLGALLRGLGTELVHVPGGFELGLDQAQQDEAIDRLRRGGVSIKSVSPRKISLEDAFIDLVQGERS